MTQWKVMLHVHISDKIQNQKLKAELQAMFVKLRIQHHGQVRFLPFLHMVPSCWAAGGRHFDTITYSLLHNKCKVDKLNETTY
jgi:hypothetical protein